MKGKSSYLKWGLTIFLTVCAILVFYDTFYMNGTLQRMVSKLASILSPVLVGLVTADPLGPGPHKGPGGKNHSSRCRLAPGRQHPADLGHCPAAAVSDVQRGYSPAGRQRGDADQ